jgi:hypothetical protein
MYGAAFLYVFPIGPSLLRASGACSRKQSLPALRPSSRSIGPFEVAVGSCPRRRVRDWSATAARSQCLTLGLPGVIVNDIE